MKEFEGRRKEGRTLFSRRKLNFSLKSWKGISSEKSSLAMMPMPYTSEGVEYGLFSITSGASQRGLSTILSDLGKNELLDRPKSATLATGFVGSATQRLPSPSLPSSPSPPGFCMRRMLGDFRSRCSYRCQITAVAEEKAPAWKLTTGGVLLWRKAKPLAMSSTT